MGRVVARRVAWGIGVACALASVPLAGCEALLSTGSLSERGTDAAGQDSTTTDGAGSSSGADSASEAGKDGATEAGPSLCTISGATYPSGTTNPSDVCQTCQPGVSATAWTNVADGLSCGSEGVCHTGSCVSGCEIGGVYYMANAVNPANVCQTCQPATSTSAWGNLMDGTACGNNQICGGGQCGTQCEIAGQVYATGAINPSNACQSCQPGSMPPTGGGTTGWTTLASGTSCGTGEVCNGNSCISSCFVSGMFYTTGQANPTNVCQSCQPAASTMAWSSVADGLPCPGAGTCTAGTCVAPTSCIVGAGGGGGLVNCGPSNENCCTSLDVAGGTFDRTYANSGSGPTGEANPASVTGFRLDKYEVTVGRFRQFVNAVMPPGGGPGWVPPPGSGKHVHLNGGMGLVNSGYVPPDGGAPEGGAGEGGASEGGAGDAGAGDGGAADAGTGDGGASDAGDGGPGDGGVTEAGAPIGYEPGWVATDDINIAPTNTNLSCGGQFFTWTNSVSGNETRPINCVNWWEAYAFCIWDGGFLPSEAELEYAEAGGALQREYPWGAIAPGNASLYAVYGCFFPSSTGACVGLSNIAPVGSPSQGSGPWGQSDLAGNVSEWGLDSFAAYVDPCMDCGYLTAGPNRVYKGGAYNGALAALVPPLRTSQAATTRTATNGLRCARTP